MNGGKDPANDIWYSAGDSNHWSEDCLILVRWDDKINKSEEFRSKKGFTLNSQLVTSVLLLKHDNTYDGNAVTDKTVSGDIVYQELKQVYTIGENNQITKIEMKPTSAVISDNQKSFNQTQNTYGQTINVESGGSNRNAI